MSRNPVREFEDTANILVIDDDTDLCRMLVTLLSLRGHAVSVAHNMRDGLAAALSGPFDAVFLDVQLPDGSGLDIIPEIHSKPSAPEIIIITGHGSPDGAELAIQNGAWDYVEKPTTVENILLPVMRALQYRREKHARNTPVSLNRHGITGSSPKITACLDSVAVAATTDASVLITGETGTGKELFASAIHKNSPRANRNFVVVDCTTLPETLIESTLFGHKEGAFTGATHSRDGMFKQAHGGTLFLDEVGELRLSLQKSLLRVLQERRFRPVGGENEIGSDFRIVAATNRNLDHMVEKGTFRKDLLFRLRSITIHLPPLRERPQDIGELVFFHMERLCNYYGIKPKGFSPEVFEALRAYDWPGNARELVNVLESALSLARNDPTFFPCHLPMHIRVKAARLSIAAPGASSTGGKELPVGEMPSLEEARREMERHYFQQLIAITGKNIQKTCRISGLSRARVYQLLKKYDL